MKSIRTIALLSLASLAMGCQTNRAFNPLATKAKEAPYSAEELAAVERVVEQGTQPASFTNKLAGLSKSRTCSTSRPSYSTRSS